MKPKKSRKNVVSRFPGRHGLPAYTGLSSLRGSMFNQHDPDGQDIIDFFAGFPDTAGPAEKKSNPRLIDACHSCVDDEGLYLTAEEVLYLEA